MKTLIYLLDLAQNSTNVMEGSGPLPIFKLEQKKKQNISLNSYIFYLNFIPHIILFYIYVCINVAFI